ncbi:hypothetical protein JD969_15115 [Planctomycetota bacterium]|nr:hypothetical protein JD969_15115 [Planctomycetota bacterium]
MYTTLAEVSDEPSWWIQMIYDALEFTFCNFVDALKPILLWIIEQIPVEIAEGIDSIVYWLDVLEYWIPINFSLGLIVAYLLLIVVYYIVMIVIKICPFIG